MSRDREEENASTTIEEGIGRRIPTSYLEAEKYRGNLRET